MSILLRDGILASSYQSATFNFQTGSYTGTGATQSITLSRGFQPDLVIIFDKAGATPGWVGFDSVNGAKNYWDWANGGTALTMDNNSLTSFNSNGFSLGSSSVVNANTHNYQYFAWKKAANFFDIQAYTGNHAARTISHSLTSAPAGIFLNVGNLSATAFGGNYIEASNPWNQIVVWANGTASTGSSSNYWNSASPTSSVFSLGASNGTNPSGIACTAYLFGTGAGSNSAFGTYVGNIVTPPSVNLGFQPTCVIILQQATSGNNIPVIYGSTASGQLNLDATAASSTNYVNLTATGFTIVTTLNSDINAAATTFQYMAWA